MPLIQSSEQKKQGLEEFYEWLIPDKVKTQWKHKTSSQIHMGLEILCLIKTLLQLFQKIFVRS